MPALESTMVSLGTQAPDFSLVDTITGKLRSLDEVRGEEATVVMFICNHCPYVKHVIDELVLIANDYRDQPVGFVAISANDIKAYPEDSPNNMAELAARLNFPFAYLYDESQDVARAYGAVCTPDFFVFDDHLKLKYRGQLDDSRPGNGIPVTGSDLRAALEALLKDNPLPEEQKPSIGCSIKWKK